MTTQTDLLPELADWNEGQGTKALDHLYAIATSDNAVAYAALFWPEFVEFEGYVLQKGFNETNLRGWEAGGDRPRRTIEAAVNYLGIGDLFMKEEETDLLYPRVVHLGRVLLETYRAKLALDFPDRRFEVSLIVEDDEYALTFFQV
jgi:hypothetical protein